MGSDVQCFAVMSWLWALQLAYVMAVACLLGDYTVANQITACAA